MEIIVLLEGSLEVTWYHFPQFVFDPVGASVGTGAAVVAEVGAYIVVAWL